MARKAAAGTAWTVTGLLYAAGPPAWRAAADEKTPPEIIAALYTAVTQLPKPGNPSHTLPLPGTALHPLINAGWRRLPLADDIVYVEPTHGLARVSRSLPRAHHAFRRTDWSINGGNLNSGPREGWHVEMSANIPSPLFAAVTTALLDRSPVERPRRSLAEEHLPYLDVTEVQAERTQATSRTTAARTFITRSAAQLTPAPGSPGTDATSSKARSR